MHLEHPSPKPEDIGPPGDKGILKMTSHHTIQFRSHYSNGTKRNPWLLFRPNEKNEPYLFTTVIWIWAPPPGSVRLHLSNLESVKTPIPMPNIRWLSQLKISSQGYALIQWSLFLPKDLTFKTSMPPNWNNKLQGHKQRCKTEVQ